MSLYILHRAINYFDSAVIRDHKVYTTLGGEIKDEYWTKETENEKRKGELKKRTLKKREIEIEN